MALLVEGISVIVRIDRIDDTYPGGRDGFEYECPNQTLIADGDLASVGFMDPADVESFCKQLEDYGLVFQREGKAIDFAVVDQLQGLRVDCDWLTFGYSEIDGNRVAVAVLSGSEKKYAIYHPEWWKFEKSLSESKIFVPNESVDEDLVFLRKEGSQEVYLHTKTGEVVYMGRTTED